MAIKKKDEENFTYMLQGLHSIQKTHSKLNYIHGMKPY